MLSDAEIRSLVTRGKLIVSNYREGQLTPNGYDLTAGRISLPGDNATDGSIPSITLSIKLSSSAGVNLM